MSTEVECWCFFCVNDKKHPTSHVRWQRVTSKLLVEESLDPTDSVPVKSCRTCGHLQEDERVD